MDPVSSNVNSHAAQPRFCTTATAAAATAAATRYDILPTSCIMPFDPYRPEQMMAKPCKDKLLTSAQRTCLQRAVELGLCAAGDIKKKPKTKKKSSS